MLAYVLAIVIAIGSVSFYMAAFFVPEMHRRQDFVWSGLGMFYAVVLWFCAGRITGAVLLGQTASVVLLSWLGWHTLELRRDLTPEPVRTPVSWDDLQQWGRAAQKKLSQYIQLDSLTRGVSTVWTDISSALADLRRKTAGPRGDDAAQVDVPPLTRSPAYEFEEAGESESVPSEFATVPTRKPQSDRVSIQPPPQPTAEVEVSPSSSPKPAAKPTSPPSPSVRVSRPEPAAQPTQPSPTSASGRSPDAGTPQPPPSPPAAAPRKAPDKSNPVTGIALWIGDIIKSMRKPKPPREVIEIPPRPPSIAKSAAAKPATAEKRDQGSDAQPPSAPRSKTPGRSKPRRAVIDIPPRPPSIPRSSAARKKPTSSPTTIPSQGEPAEFDSNSVTETNPSSDRSIEPSQVVMPDSAQPSDQSNPQAGEPTLDTTWPDESTEAVFARVEPEPTPAKDEAETNWPDDDDEDTNWPD